MSLQSVDLPAVSSRNGEVADQMTANIPQTARKVACARQTHRRSATTDMVRPGRRLFLAMTESDLRAVFGLVSPGFSGFRECAPEGATQTPAATGASPLQG